MTAVEKLRVEIIAQLKEFRKAMDNVEGRVDQTAEKLKSFGSKASRYVSLPLAGVGAAAVKSAMDFERLEMGLGAIMGSSEAAAEEMERLKEVARAPGLGLKQALRGSTNLQAVGFSADEARSALSNMGNALALVGGTAADLDGVTRALTQIVSKGTVSAEEINQLAERIPQIRTAMEEAFGTADTEELQKQGIEGKEFVNELVAELGNLPPAADTVANQFNNLKQDTQLLLKELGVELLPVVKDVVGVLTEAARWFTELPKGVKTTVVSVGALATAIGPVSSGLGTILGLLPALKTGMIATFTAIKANLVATGIGALLVGLGTAAYFVYDNWAWFRKQFKIIMARTSLLVLQAQKKMLEFADTIASKFGSIFPGIERAAVTALGNVKRQISETQQELLDAQNIQIGEKRPEVESKPDEESAKDTGKKIRDKAEEVVRQAGPIPVPAVVPKDVVVEGDQVQLDDESLMGDFTTSALLQMDAENTKSIRNAQSALSTLRESYEGATDPEFRQRIAKQILAYQKQIEVLDILNQKQETTKQKTKGILQQYQFLNNAVVSFGEGMASALTNAIAEGENFGEAMTSVLKDVLKMMLQTVIQATILGGILSLFSGGSLGSNIGGLLKGNSFSDMMTSSSSSLNRATRAINRGGFDINLNLQPVQLQNGVMFTSQQSYSQARMRRGYREQIRI